MSWQRLLRKVRRLVRAPRSARDLVPRYDDYLKLQSETYLSFESEVPEWHAGQKRFVEQTMKDGPRDLRILDCACGDGAGLSSLRELCLLYTSPRPRD